MATRTSGPGIHAAENDEKRGEIHEHQLEPHPLHEYEGDLYRRELTSLLGRR
jgi:hypothetical protein